MSHRIQKGKTEMDELENRLNFGNNISIAQLISRIVQNVASQQKDNNKETAELKFLKEKCISMDHAVSEVACSGILHLVKIGVLQAKPTLADFTTIVTTTSCPSSIIFLLNNLLLAEVKDELSRNKIYKCPFNLRLPLHPFITMLNENSSCWFRMFNEIIFSYKSDDKEIRYFCNEVYKPVFFYVICDPSEYNLTIFKQKLWTFVISNQVPQSADVLSKLLCWIQLQSREAIQANSEFIIELAEMNLKRKIIEPDVLLLWQISCLHHLIFNSFDPRAIISSIAKVLRQCENLVTLNCALLMIAKSIPGCPSLYLLELLNLSKLLIARGNFHAIIKQVVKSSLLQWVANPSILTEDTVAATNEIFAFIESNPGGLLSHGIEAFSKRNREILNTNSEVYLNVQLCVQLENWKSNNDLVDWLDRVETAPNFFTIKIISFLFGILLSDFNDAAIHLRVFNLILKCSDEYRKVLPNILTLILFKLSNTTDSDLHYKLLKTLPKMAVTKDNVQKVLCTILALSKGPDTLQTFGATLMFDLWQIENKCYSHLENLLIAPYNSQCSKKEFYVTRARILKELCLLKPELYGKELVAHLSKILNECNDPDGSVASALAIDGIAHLCKVEIIDAVTTWAQLTPMFQNETRTVVIKSLCSLISEIPQLSYIEAYPKLSEEAVATLWSYLKVNAELEVWQVALTALTSFNLDQITAQMPEEYLDDQEVLNVKPGSHTPPVQCWINLLRNSGSSYMPLVGDFLVKLISLEIAAYLKYVYQVKTAREPLDYSYLPTNSVVRTVGWYLKSLVQKWRTDIHRDVYLECLRIFSHKFSKPLPPLDWCFLQEVMHDVDAKNYCVSIAAHQVILSGTARRLVENYIVAVTEDETKEEDILHIYRNLEHLANSIQPVTLKPFMEITIINAVDSFKRGNCEVLKNILGYLKMILKNSEIQDTNKAVIAGIITGLSDEIDFFSELFQFFVECIALFPVKEANLISSPKSVKEPTTDWFRKAVKIRCQIAINTKNSALNLLNDLIEVGSSFATVTSYLFEQFAEVFKKHKDNTDCALWLLAFLGQIQAIVADKGDKRNIIYQCDVFMLATVIFSGHYVFLKDISQITGIYKLFPQALATLLSVNHWSICTTLGLEWLYYMYTLEEVFSEEQRTIFKQCLQALRNESEFKKNMCWMKYFGVDC